MIPFSTTNSPGVMELQLHLNSSGEFVWVLDGSLGNRFFELGLGKSREGTLNNAKNK
jgi:hypothetical protein